jgi:hypothetical protein
MINNIELKIEHLLREPEEPLVSVTAIVFFYIKDDPLQRTQEIKR